MQDNQKLLQVLKSELTFLEQGGYRRGPRFPFRPNFIFEDSPTCINFRQADADRRPCQECHLMHFVPLEKRATRYPCRYIRLNEAGDTVHSFYEYGTEDELESALAGWLKEKIQELESGNRFRVQAA